MLYVNLFDREFIHTESLLGYITCSDTLKPKTIKWINGLPEFSGITVFTDRYARSTIVDAVKSKLKILWLLEPPVIRPELYQNLEQVENKFDYILTYDENLLTRGSKYLKYVVGQSRVSDEEARLHKKSKTVSLIASNKSLSIGHRFRHDIAQSIPNLDLWGSAYKKFESKLDPLKDYMFTIAIMNCKMNNFFTEVLVDPLRLGTIPIFWGCPNVGDYFDARGIITFDTKDELKDILNSLTIERYELLRPYAENNLKLANNYLSTDDNLASIFKRLL